MFVSTVPSLLIKNIQEILGFMCEMLYPLLREYLLSTEQ